MGEGGCGDEVQEASVEKEVRHKLFSQSKGKLNQVPLFS